MTDFSQLPEEQIVAFVEAAADVFGKVSDKRAEVVELRPRK